MIHVFTGKTSYLSSFYRSALCIQHFLLNSLKYLFFVFRINSKTFCLEFYHFRSKITP